MHYLRVLLSEIRVQKLEAWSIGPDSLVKKFEAGVPPIENLWRQHNLETDDPGGAHQEFRRENVTRLENMSDACVVTDHNRSLYAKRRLCFCGDMNAVGNTAPCPSRVSRPASRGGVDHAVTQRQGALIVRLTALYGFFDRKVLTCGVATPPTAEYDIASLDLDSGGPGSPRHWNMWEPRSTNVLHLVSRGS